MNPILRVLHMADESTSGRYWAVIFLASVDLVCVFEAGDSIREGHVKTGIFWLGAAILFSLVGFKWPWIRTKLGMRTAVEQPDRSLPERPPCVLPKSYGKNENKFSS